MSSLTLYSYLCLSQFRLPEHRCSVARACCGRGCGGEGGSVSPGVLSEGGEVSDGGGGHPEEAQRILKDNQSCFSLKNFPLK